MYLQPLIFDGGPPRVETRSDAGKPLKREFQRQSSQFLFFSKLLAQRGVLWINRPSSHHGLRQSVRAIPEITVAYIVIFPPFKLLHNTYGAELA